MTRSGFRVEHLADGVLGQTTRVAGVAVAELVALGAGDGDLRRVDDDDEVTGVDVQGELRLVLAAQKIWRPDWPAGRARCRWRR